MDNQTGNHTDKPNQPNIDAGQALEANEATEQPGAPSQPTDPAPDTEAPLDLSAQQKKVDLSKTFSWQATEYVQYNHSTYWYVIFAIGTFGLLAIAIFAMRNLMFSILVPIMSIAVILLSRKPPRLINYSISPDGIQIDSKLYDFSEFKSFGVIHESAHPSVTLHRANRLGSSLALYFDKSEGEMIVDLLGARIPMIDIKPNLLDKIIHITRL